MQKSKIEWTDYTWNPIKGLCLVGCWYCYARKMYNSKFYSKPPFDNPRIRLELMGSIERKGRGKIKDGSKIFVCSTMEIFHPEVQKDWRDLIFGFINSNPQHTFQILTKMPENIDRPMPDNVWLGVSITSGIEFYERSMLLRMSTSKIKFISFEPLFSASGLYIPQGLGWAIIGRLTQHGKKHDPKKEEIQEIVTEARAFQVPIFLKNNLKDIWGEDLIQEFPE